ncbi:tetratricopeptide repeat protein [Devosia insulae]|uniref:tetratricopeptide repeat protein n=1 Tax=Devosia insulae TaxID=408174 RepID=UPI000A008879|nr:tetratricopeptide repeat protein [Devosia insulae]
MPLKLLTKTLTVLTLVAGMLAAAPVLAVDGGGGGGGGSSGGGGGYDSSSDSGSRSEVRGPSLNDARALIRAQKWKSAATMLKQIVRADPRSAEANNLLGYSLRKSGDYKNAQGFYLKALKLDPRHKGANEYLGELYVEIGQLAKANKQLATLEMLCGNTSCKEYQALAKFIATKS